MKVKSQTDIALEPKHNWKTWTLGIFATIIAGIFVTVFTHWWNAPTEKKSDQPTSVVTQSISIPGNNSPATIATVTINEAPGLVAANDQHGVANSTVLSKDESMDSFNLQIHDLITYEQKRINAESQPVSINPSPSSGIGTLNAVGNGNTIIGVNNGTVTSNSTTVNETINLINIGGSSPVTAQGIYDQKNTPQKDGRYLTSGRIKIISPYPVGGLYVGVSGQTIKMFTVAPIQGGGSMGNMGNNSTYFYEEIKDAYGEYYFLIFSSAPEDFKIEYKIE